MPSPPRDGTEGLSAGPAGPLPRLFVLALLVLGCGALWVGIPIAGMFIAGELTDEFGWHMPIALALVLPAMFLCAALLAWLNELYLRISGSEIEQVSGLRYRNRGPLEPLMVVSLFLAVVGFVIWFFFLAENPSSQVL